MITLHGAYEASLKHSYVFSSHLCTHCDRARSRLHSELASFQAWFHPLGWSEPGRLAALEASPNGAIKSAVTTRKMDSEWGEPPATLAVKTLVQAGVHAKPPAGTVTYSLTLNSFLARAIANGRWPEEAEKSVL
ncbi:hypothetical protein ZHAS_00010680 [Anopheles sinensis]|uniref:Uncharacterized protein n=1 Tax=Anopheles sinensis TaxID=74873 RepID=A0A084VYG4_ANOSI|nr:hypothetical protein ZHAS_00010680 [Anopheles sinensis]